MASGIFNVCLKTAIIESGLTQREIGRQAGIPEIRLSNIVRGWADAREDEKVTLSRVLKRPAGMLFHRGDVQLQAS